MAFTATGGPGAVPYIAPPTTAGQMFQAIAASLSGGINGFLTWLPGPADDASNLAYWHRQYATSLSVALLAYMQAPTGSLGLGMSLAAAQSKLVDLLALAAQEPG